MKIINIDNYALLVDDEDVDKITSLKWYINKKNVTKYGLIYFEHFFAYTNSDGKRRRKVISLHRFILGCLHGDGKIVDHIDGNTLNNQKDNLRICTNRENAFNQKRGKRNTSGYKGVSWSKRDKCWYAQIRVNGKETHIGCFHDPKKAHEAYQSAARKHFGKYARFE